MLFQRTSFAHNSEGTLSVDDFEWTTEESENDDSATLAGETCSTIYTEHEGASMDEDEPEGADEDEDERYPSALPGPSSSPSSSNKRAYGTFK